jgi:CheY-like chemotaxis protein
MYPTKALFPRVYYFEKPKSHYRSIKPHSMRLVEEHELKSTGITDLDQTDGMIDLKKYAGANGEVLTSNKKEVMRTLHIEDNAEIRLIVKCFLRKNFTVESVATGQQALEIIRQKKFDLIIVDINLGDGPDGIETARLIRNVEGYADTPIIAATANLYTDVRDNCIKAGIDAFIQKPFLKIDLVNTISQVIYNRGN